MSTPTGAELYRISTDGSLNLLNHPGGLEVFQSSDALPPILEDSGDINQDGAVDVADLVRVLNVLEGNAGLNFTERQNADFNGDGQITARDAGHLVDAIMRQ